MVVMGPGSRGEGPLARSVLIAAGIDSPPVADIRTVVWHKLLMNLMNFA